MFDERWNGFRLELATIEIGGTEDRGNHVVPADCDIRGVVFEPCGVLYDDSAWRRWLWQLVARMGLHSHYTPFFRVWDCEFQEDVWSGQLDMWTALDRFLRSAGMPRPDIDEVIAATRAKFRRFEQQTRPYPDVCFTARRLHATGIELAVLAHAHQEDATIRGKLDQVGMGGFVTRILAQESSLDPFEACLWPAAAFASLPDPSNGWMFVGRRQSVLDAARRTGLLTVAFNHDADADADVYIEQFSQLEQILDRRRAQRTGYPPAKAA